MNAQRRGAQSALGLIDLLFASLQARAFNIEQLVGHLYDVLDLATPYQNDLSARINTAAFKAEVGMGVIDELTENGIMEPGRLFESPYTDRGSVDAIFPNDVAVLVEILRDVNGHAVPTEVA